MYAISKRSFTCVSDCAIRYAFTSVLDSLNKMSLLSMLLISSQINTSLMSMTIEVFSSALCLFIDVCLTNLSVYRYSSLPFSLAFQAPMYTSMIASSSLFVLKTRP